MRWIIIFLSILSLPFLISISQAGFISNTDSTVLMESNQFNIPSWRSATFTSNGTFVVPGDIFEVYVNMAAGGASSSGAFDKGGQGGDFCWNYKVDVTPGENISVVIGDGGKLNNDGQNSTFGSYIILGGGQPGSMTGGDESNATGSREGYTILKNTTNSTQNIIFHGAGGGGPTDGNGGSTPFYAGGWGCTGRGCGGAGLFGLGGNETDAPAANSGAGSGNNVYSGASGQCVIKWFK